MSKEQVKEGGVVTIVEDGVNPLAATKKAANESAYFRLMDILQQRVEVAPGMKMKPLTLNDLAELEHHFGDINKIDEAISGSLVKMRTLLWILCKREQPGITVEEVGALITMENMETLNVAIAQVMGVAGNSQAGATEAAKSIGE